MINSQELANTIKDVAKSKKIAIGKMLSDCGLSVNTLSSMQSGGYYPRLEAIAKIADYLSVSVDYLLSNETMEKHPAKIGEVPEILKKYYILNEDDRRTVEIMIDSFLQKDCYKQKESVG